LLLVRMHSLSRRWKRRGFHRRWMLLRSCKPNCCWRTKLRWMRLESGLMCD
jgi:hypothetical protein